MESPAEPHSATPQQPAAPEPRRRLRRVFAASRALVRLVHRDPEHVAERLTLFAIDHIADETERWAQSAGRRRPDTSAAELGEEQRLSTAQLARIDGAISGTPFFIALVPGYVSYLWQEMRMTMRIAALHGRDPRALATAGEMLALRGVHPDVASAEAALTHVKQTPVPERPPRRRSLRTWVHSVYLVLVFGGFLSAAAAERPPPGWLERLRSAASLLAAGAVWALTWIFPVTFMILMAWGCESHARQLGRRALVFYGGEAADVNAAIALAARRHDRGHGVRAIVRGLALFLSLAIPLAFIALVVHQRKVVGVNWLGALATLVAISLIIAMGVIANRRSEST